MWIDCDGVCDISAWVHELDPTEPGTQSGAAWVLEHLQSSYNVEDFREWFALDPEKCYQVLFKGVLNGGWSGLPGEEEYDEDIDLGDFGIVEVPAEYLDKVFGSQIKESDK
jgi:hypothetical protein